MTFADLLNSITLPGFESALYHLPDGYSYFVDIAPVEHALYPLRESWRLELDRSIQTLKGNMVRDQLEVANMAQCHMEAGVGYMIQVQVTKQTAPLLEALTGDAPDEEDTITDTDGLPDVEDTPRPQIRNPPAPPRSAGRRNG